MQSALNNYITAAFIHLINSHRLKHTKNLEENSTLIIGRYKTINPFKQSAVAEMTTQWRRNTRARQVKWPGWKIHRPGSCPGSALPRPAACVLRATTKKVNFFEETKEKSASGWPGWRIFWTRNDLTPLLRWSRHWQYLRCRYMHEITQDWRLFKAIHHHSHLHGPASALQEIVSRWMRSSTDAGSWGTETVAHSTLTVMNSSSVQ